VWSQGEGGKKKKLLEKAVLGVTCISRSLPATRASSREKNRSRKIYIFSIPLSTKEKEKTAFVEHLLRLTEHPGKGGPETPFY